MLNKIFFMMVLVSFTNIFSVETRAMGEPGKIYIVNASPVNVREKPSIKGSKIGTLTKGQKVIFIEEKEFDEIVIDMIQAPWVKIKTEDGKITGWMFGGYLVNNIGDTNLALGYRCIDFKKMPLAEFKGGCGDRNPEGPVQGAGECNVEFGADKTFNYILGQRSRVGGKWELQGNKIVVTISENSKETICNAWDPNGEDCIKEHMSTFGKKDAIVINYKLEFTVNPAKNSLILKVNSAKDPKPLLLKKTFKSSVANKEISCIIAN